MSGPFFWCIVTLFALAGIGSPVALSMIVSSIVYLLLKGQDIGLAAEQMIQGLYDGFLLLAIPLFIVAANIMNAGTISERLLKFCLALVGPVSRRAWPCECCCQHDFRRHVRFGGGGRGRSWQNHHRDDAQG